MFKVFYCGIATLPHEWAGLTVVFPQPHIKPVRNSTCPVFHRVIKDTGGPFFYFFYLMPLLLRLSMGGGIRLPGDMSAYYLFYKKKVYQCSG